MADKEKVRAANEALVRRLEMTLARQRNAVLQTEMQLEAARYYVETQRQAHLELAGKAK